MIHSSRIITPSYAVESSPVDGGYAITLRLPGYAGRRVTKEMMNGFPIRPPVATTNKHGVLIFKDAATAMRCANAVDMHLTNKEEA